MSEETARRPRARAQEELASRIHWETLRRAGEPSGSRYGEGVPGDLLVEDVGRLALLASEEDARLYERSLWPRVRRCLQLDSPGALARGSFAPCVEASRLALETPLAVRLAARDTQLPGLDADVRSLLLTRLQAGYFLTGIEALWPVEGQSAARRLWGEGGLGEWDAYLQQCAALVRDARPALAEDFVGESLPLEGPWLAGLRTLLALSAAPTVPDGVEGGGWSVQRRLLVEEVVDAEVRVRADRLGCWGVEPAGEDWLIVRGEAGAVGVWFPGSPEGTLCLEPEAARPLSAMVVAQLSELVLSDDEGGAEGVRVVDLRGSILMPCVAVGDAITLAVAQAQGGREAALEALSTALQTQPEAAEVREC